VKLAQDTEDTRKPNRTRHDAVQVHDLCVFYDLRTERFASLGFSGRFTPGGVVELETGTT